MTQATIFFTSFEHHGNVRIRIGPSGKKPLVGLQATHHVARHGVSACQRQGRHCVERREGIGPSMVQNALKFLSSFVTGTVQ